jgi:hypothetical protein
MKSPSPNKIPRPETPSPADPRREWLAAGTGAVSLLVLYGAFPERVYIFDGILFSGIIERIGDNWRADLFNGRHLLFNPSMMLLRDIALRVGLTISGYSLIQAVNAVVAALGILLFGRLVYRLTRDKGLALTFAGLLAITCNYWDRATEGQVYMLMTFGALATAYGALAFAQEATPASALMLCAAFTAAVLFHSVNIVLLPMVLFALWVGSSKAAKSTVLGAASLIAAGVTVPFLIAFKIWSSASLKAFFVKTLELYSTGEARSGPGLIGKIYSSEPLNLGVRLSGDANALYSALIAHSPMGGFGAAAICLGLAFATYAAMRRAQDRRPLILMVLFGTGYAFINSFWHGGEFFWSPPLAAALALVAAAVAPRLAQVPPKRRRGILGWVGALAIALGGWNFQTDVQPRSRLSNNLSYRYTMFIGEHAVPFSWVIISGISDSNLKSYLPYFAHRNREVVEYFFNNQSKAAGLDLLRQFIQRKVQYGIPLYLLPDLVQDKSVDEVLRQRWGVSPDDLHGCFGSGHVVRVNQESDLSLFLFIPRDQTELLFANLMFQALTADQRRSQEIAGILKNIAKFELPPARLRSAVDIAEHSDYGARLLWEGIFKDLNPSARSKAENDIKGFDAYQKSPEFYLRLGELYRSIGLADDAHRQLNEGFRLTHDPKLRDAARAF